MTDSDAGAERGHPPLNSVRYTSIVYFHGMGTPRRYEEPSRVLDTLDRYAHAQPDERVGMLRDQKVGIERSRVGEAEPVTFISFARFIRGPGSKPRRVGVYRLYESYWSPAAAGGLSPFAVLGWVLLRTANPFVVLLRPWRAHQRLKLTYLNRLFYDRGAIPARRFAELEKLYRDFESMPARRDHPLGLFRAFKKTVRAATENDHRAQADLLHLARRWKQSLTWSQVATALFAATVVAGLLGLTTLAVFLAAFVLNLAAPDLGWLEAITGKARGAPAWLVAPGAGLLFVSFVAAAAFMRNFLADVVFWTTTGEKDVRYQKRRDILRACEATLRHVLEDQACERVVVVAHSLGTAIAYETLLAFGRKVAAEQRDYGGRSPLEDKLRKISHVVTLGSPIDWIAYFFSLTYSRYHRFNRVADTLLGKTSDAPFRVDRQRVIQWINIRDASDPISSRLFSARGPIPNRDAIHEVEVTCSHIPDPAKAHTGYFDAELGARVLFDTCIFGRSAMQLTQSRSNASRLWVRAARVMSWGATGLASWALATGALGFWWESPGLMKTAQTGILIAFVTVLLTAVVGGFWDRVERLTVPT